MVRSRWAASAAMSAANCRANSASRLAASCWAYPDMVVSELRSPNAISRRHFATQLLLAANLSHFSPIVDQRRPRPILRCPAHAPNSPLFPEFVPHLPECDSALPAVDACLLTQDWLRPPRPDSGRQHRGGGNQFSIAKYLGRAHPGRARQNRGYASLKHWPAAPARSE